MEKALNQQAARGLRSLIHKPMSFYPDLSRRYCRPKTFRVGWLDGEHPFETFRPPKWMVEKLWAHCQYSLIEFRGFHQCNLAGCPGPAKKLRHPRRSKAAIIREFAQQQAFLDNFVEKTKTPKDDPVVANFRAMYNEGFKCGLRGYSRMILAIHPVTGEQIELGYAEIRVFGKRGKSYAAPNMLYHYVTDHHYKPPDEFIEALKAGPCPPEQEYFDRFQALRLSFSMVQSYKREQEAEKLKATAKELKPTAQAKAGHEFLLRQKTPKSIKIKAASD